MATRNLAWAASNETRFFPFDDGATLVDNARKRPPAQLVADLKVLSPDTYGRYLYVGAISVTPMVVTVIVMASTARDTIGQPIASISQRLPITKHYPYALSPQAAGVGGWISFGDLDDLEYQGRFTLPSQSLLSPLAARGYKCPPIDSVRSVGGNPLRGLVKLSGGNDVTITRECREVPDHAVDGHHESYCGDEELGTQVRDVLVFRLRNKVGDERNVFEIYAGPCSKRPATRTCGDPQPVEFVGATAPDCAGNITVNLLGCLDVLAVRELVTVDEDGDPVLTEDATGVILACGLGLEDACISDSRLPDSEGKLPSEYDDLCESVSSLSESEDGDEGGEGGEGEAPPFEFDEDEASLSFQESISEDFDVTDDWVLRFGSFVSDDDAPIFISGASSRNVATYEPTDTPTGIYRRVRARVRLNAEPLGSLHNACVVANYKSGAYYVAEIDWDGHYRGFKQFRIAKFDGTRWIGLFSKSVPSLQIGHQYDISLDVLPHANADDAWLTARLVNITSPGLDITIGPLAVNGYMPATGPFGLGSNRSAAHYINFEIESITDV